VTRRDRTHERLLTCALDLFERQGFEATTVAQIAAAAGVTEMTFFRHFAAKDRVLFDDPYDPVIARAVGEQPRTLAPLSRAVIGLRAAWALLPEPESELARRRVRIAASTPGLRASFAANSALTEAIIAQQLIDDGADPFAARVAAAAVLAGVSAALLEWARSDNQTLAHVFNAAMDILENRHG
jgi:AcrR family transcriptional regulator